MPRSPLYVWSKYRRKRFSSYPVIKFLVNWRVTLAGNIGNRKWAVPVEISKSPKLLNQFCWKLQNIWAPERCFGRSSIGTVAKNLMATGSRKKNIFEFLKICISNNFEDKISKKSFKYSWRLWPSYSISHLVSLHLVMKLLNKNKKRQYFENWIFETE